MQVNVGNDKVKYRSGEGREGGPRALKQLGGFAGWKKEAENEKQGPKTSQP